MNKILALALLALVAPSPAATADTFKELTYAVPDGWEPYPGR